MKDLLIQCGINENNFGSCVGGMDWISTKDAGENSSYCPSNESLIASVYEANDDDYEHIVTRATSAFEQWRKVPAPIRGDLCLLYTSPSPRDGLLSRMPSSA